VSRPLTRSTVTSAFLRSFLIQGSWNYHTMIANGFAFAMLPALKRLFGDDPEALDAALRRHLEHFNAHPYLSGLALGAALRLEADGTDAETVTRFKTAIRGPLGGLGDALVWATWLPTVSMLALALWWIRMPGWITVGVFLVLYNAGHLVLRVWGFRSGLREGRAVAQALTRANLVNIYERLQEAATVMLGLLAGAALAGPTGLVHTGLLWAALGMLAFVVGLKIGHRIWRPTAIAVVTTIALISTWGIVT
jgi:PTS system mannose-specific IID component